MQHIYRPRLLRPRRVSYHLRQTESQQVKKTNVAACILQRPKLQGTVSLCTHQRSATCRAT